MNVLIACEESQAVCKAFREKGHNAFSCDIQECSGGHPEWHIQGDVLEILNPHQISNSFYGIVFRTVDGKAHAIKGKWDMIIAHPPCTYLSNAGALEYCISDNDNICTGCAALKNGIDCALEYSIILDLIKRQQAEIDRLNIDLKAMRGAANSWKAEVQRICKKEFDNIEIDVETVKSEAVREFAERLKEYCNEITNQEWNKRTLPVSWADAYEDFIDDIDRLLEEMGCNDG